MEGAKEDPSPLLVSSHIKPLQEEKRKPEEEVKAEETIEKKKRKKKKRKKKPKAEPVKMKITSDL